MRAWEYCFFNKRALLACYRPEIMRRIAFLVQLPKNVSPGQRFRIEQFEPTLAEKGYQLHTYPFLNRSTYQVIYKPGNLFKKFFGVTLGFLNRVWFLLNAFRYDFIFLQREAAPLGPPFFEWVLAKVLKKKLILDFDDAIWISNTSEGNNLAHYLKCNWKVKYLCKWSYKVSVGNDYLYEYAKRFAKKVVLIPTGVDTENRFNKHKRHTSKTPVIGWTGSHSTLPYLDAIFPVLKRLDERYQFQFLVICNEAPKFSLSSLKFIPWREETEIEDLLQMDIGLMPLKQDEWSEGKCGFKIIQYLSLGIPAVASPVGVNKVIVQDDKNGYLCETQDEWYNAIARLIEEPALRERLGNEGRIRMDNRYSVKANRNHFVSLFS
jgi:glycosyltransferase involved in cell wall biosynthesis